MRRVKLSIGLVHDIEFRLILLVSWSSSALHIYYSIHVVLVAGGGDTSTMSATVHNPMYMYIRFCEPCGTVRRSECVTY